MANTSGKTSSITFRLKSETLSALKYEADKRSISLNVMVNQVLDNFTGWKSSALDAGLISFPKSLLVRITEHLTDEEIKKVTKEHFENDVESIILRTEMDFSADSFMLAMQAWMKDNNLPYQHSVKGTLHTYVIQHNMGKKWSLFLSELCRLVFEKTEKRRVKINSSENVFTLLFGKDAALKE